MNFDPVLTVLHKTLGSTEFASRSGMLSRSLNEISSFSYEGNSDGNLQIGVINFDKDTDVSGLEQAWFSTDVPLKIHNFNATIPISKKTGALHSALSIVVINVDEADPDFISFQLGNYNKFNFLQLVLFTGQGDSSKKRLIERAVQKHAIKTFYQPYDVVFKITLKDLLDQFEWSGVVEFTKNITVLNALFSIIDAVRVQIDQDREANVGKRVIAESQQIEVNSTSSGSKNDQLNKFKGEVQNDFSELDIGLKKVYEQKFAQKTGNYWELANKRIGELANLSSETLTKKLVLTIPEDFEKEVLSELRAYFEQATKMDVDNIKRFEEQEIKKINDFLESVHIDKIEITGNAQMEGEIESVLNNSVYVERSHKSETRKQGFYEYLTAVRKYSMIFFMLVPMLGLSQYLKEYDHIVLPLSFVLLGVGIVSVVISVKKERKETEKNELDKAREFLKKEYKRIENDFQRQWIVRITEAINKMLRSTMQKIDERVNTSNQQFHASLEKEKSSSKFKLNQLSSMEKSMTEHVRVLDNVVRQMDQMEREIKQTGTRTMQSAKITIANE